MKVNHFRNLLVSQRKVAGWSQEELAERSGVSVRTIRNLETGTNKNPRRASVELILAAFSASTTGGGIEISPEQRHAVATIDMVDSPAGLFDGSRSSWHGIRPRTDLVGRQADLRQIATAVQRGRVTVLTGPAGAGKTRLALAAAARIQPMFADGVSVVELGGVPPEVDDETGGRRNVRQAIEQGMPPVAGDPADEPDTNLLLVIDNAEHVVNSASHVIQQMLAEHPRLSLIVTSRRPLALTAAYVWEVAPWTHLPSGSSDAAELFVNRVGSAVPTLDLSDQMAVVLNLCRRLDGLPLAIEAAAQRLRSISLTTLLRGGPILPMLGPANIGGLSHNRPLAAGVQWSYDLLTAAQRDLLHHLAAGPSRFTIDDLVRTPRFTGTAGMANLNLLAELVDASMIQVRRGEVYEYEVLNVVRDYVTGRQN
ncbi:helix-turn-helix domain-containing protein [Dactylosporangium sp. NPDC000555]|uniref:helix-turn-helix domain-containing protein n=1 Tax=Dactylosporangium sp. NPDC000555 TaxID=3154260 RepID=UPI00331ACB6A